MTQLPVLLPQGSLILNRRNWEVWGNTCAETCPKERDGLDLILVTQIDGFIMLVFFSIRHQVVQSPRDCAGNLNLNCLRQCFDIYQRMIFSQDNQLYAPSQTVVHIVAISQYKRFNRETPSSSETYPNTLIVLHFHIDICHLGI